MCMAADNSFYIAASCFTGEGAFVIVEDVEGDLSVIGEEFGQGETFDRPFHRNIDGAAFLQSVRDEIIQPVGHARYRAAQKGAVKLVSMHDKKITAIGAFVNGAVPDLDVHAAGITKALYQGEVPHGFVMVTGNIDDGRSFMRLPEQFIKNFVDRFGPVPAFVKLPSVDNIADKIQRLRFRFAQEIEKGGCIEIFCADVKIGQEDGTVNLRFCLCSVGQAEPR